MAAFGVQYRPFQPMEKPILTAKMAYIETYK